MPARFIRASEAARRTGLSVRSVKRKASDPTDDFPPGIKLGERIIVWVEAEVDDWIEAQISRYRRAAS